MESKSLQIWPGGHSFTYRGDSQGPADLRSLRDGYRHEENPQWRPGTPDEWRQIRIEELAEMYQQRDILCCDSSLVDDLLKSAQSGSADAYCVECGADWLSEDH